MREIRTYGSGREGSRRLPPYLHVRPAAHVTSGLKSRRRDLYKCCTLRRRRQPSVARRTVKGRIQTAARNESERDSAARAGELAEESEAPYRNPSRGWRRDVGNSDVRDRGRPRMLRQGPISLGGTDVARVNPSVSGRPRSQSGS